MSGHHPCFQAGAQVAELMLRPFEYTKQGALQERRSCEIIISPDGSFQKPRMGKSENVPHCRQQKVVAMELATARLVVQGARLGL